jgi:hypothetical protein
VSVCLGTATTLKASSNAFCNNALVFDGIDDYVNVNQLLTGVTNNFTVEAWVNPTATHEIDAQSTTGVTGFNNQRYLIFPINGNTWATDHAGMGISVGTNGVSVYEHANNYMPALLVWQGTLNGWTHLAVVYTNKQPSLYINGVLVKTGQTSTKSYVHPSTGFGGGPYGYFKGSIDELRIWNMTRTASQIQTAKKTSLLGTTPGLVGYWKLNEGIGSTAVDATASNNTGTLSKGFNSLSGVNNLLMPPLTTTSASWQVPSTAPVSPTFTWSPATGLSATTGASVKATLTKPSTTYTVTDGVSTASVTVTTAQCGGRLAAEEVEVSNSSDKVYPNPFAGQTRLYIRTAEPEPLTIVISDLQGRVIESSTAHKTNEIIGVGEGITQGVYLLRAVHGNSV